ncbi:hypothetical protein H8958_021068 [Nasalis larvatus]
MRLLEKLCSSNSGSSAPKPAFAKVLTPNRIPEFCIPPRLPAPCALESPSRAAALPRRCAAERDLWPRAADEDAGRTDWDPRSQAALSLPHLPRVLTAYGFCSPARATSASPPSSRDPLPERLEAEGTLALGRAGDALRLAAEYCPGTGRLRLRLLRAEGLAGGAPGPRAVRCRLSLVLRPPDTARRQCSIVVGRSRKASFDQDFCFDGLSEDEVRRLAVRVKAWDEGRGRERGRLLGQGELSLGALLLL